MWRDLFPKPSAPWGRLSIQTERHIRTRAVNKPLEPEWVLRVSEPNNTLLKKTPDLENFSLPKKVLEMGVYPTGLTVTFPSQSRDLFRGNEVLIIKDRCVKPQKRKIKRLNSLSVKTSLSRLSSIPTTKNREAQKDERFERHTWYNRQNLIF